MCAIPQLVSAPLNPTPTVEHFGRSYSQCNYNRTKDKGKYNNIKS